MFRFYNFYLLIYQSINLILDFSYFVVLKEIPLYETIIKFSFLILLRLYQKPFLLLDFLVFLFQYEIKDFK